MDEKDAIEAYLVGILSRAREHLDTRPKKYYLIYNSSECDVISTDYSIAKSFFERHGYALMRAESVSHDEDDRGEFIIVDSEDVSEVV